MRICLAVTASAKALTCTALLSRYLSTAWHVNGVGGAAVIGLELEAVKGGRIVAGGNHHPANGVLVFTA